MIGGPLGNNLMAFYKAHGEPVIPATFVTMGTLYFVFMMYGVFTIRVPAAGWKPEGWMAPVRQAALISTHNVEVATAWRTLQFALLWVVLCMNVTAGIGILEQASPVILHIMSGLLMVGLVANLMVRPVAERYWMEAARG